MTESELNRIVSSHREWLSSYGQQGSRADLAGKSLRGCDLSDADLRRANLSGADLSEAKLLFANLRDADLREANLRGSDLTGAHLVHSDLTGTILVDTILKDADLRAATGLQEHSLRGADLSNAELPDAVGRFDGLDEAARIVGHARVVFVSMVVVCAYSWLTIATTTDPGLILDARRTVLPLFRAEIPIALFFKIAPVLLVALYGCLHLYLQNLWTAVADLPGVFPDGKAIDRKSSGWLVEAFARAHVPVIRGHRSPYGVLRVFASIALGWLLVPFTILLFWTRYLPRHDWPWTLWLIILLAVAVGFGGDSYRLARRTLRGYERSSSLRRQKEYSARFARTGQSIERVLVVVVPIIIFVIPCLWISFQAIQGDLAEKEYNPRLVDRFKTLVRPCMVADLRDQAISERDPAWNASWNAWMASGQVGDPPLIVGARLKGCNLRYALMDNVFLAGADLPEADLVGASLIHADLRAANLRSVDLSDAQLRDANFQCAKVWGARLRRVNLHRADLQQAILWESRLEFADLHKTHFEGATLWDANMRGANAHGAYFNRAVLAGTAARGARFRWATFQNADLTNAYWEESDLWHADLTGADLTRAKLRKAILRSTKLSRANFHEADLRDADFDEADMENANLWGTQLHGANLRTAKNLTQDQVDEACCDDTTALPPHLDGTVCRENGAISEASVPGAAGHKDP